MKKKLLLFAISLIIFTFTFPLAASAVCTKSGTVVRVTFLDDPIPGYHYIYLKTSALSPIYFFVRTLDDDIAGIAATALTSQTRVTIQGDVETCPISGFLGNLRYLILNP